jgi:hypothetical protein
VAYTVLPDGVRVYDRNRVIVGEVEHVLADEGQDIFHGLIVHTPDGYRFAHREQIAELHREGVLLSVPGTALREPRADPVAAEAGRPISQQLQEGLRRAWEWMSQPR